MFWFKNNKWKLYDKDWSVLYEWELKNWVPYWEWIMYNHGQKVYEWGFLNWNMHWYWILYYIDGTKLYEGNFELWNPTRDNSSKKRFRIRFQYSMMFYNETWIDIFDNWDIRVWGIESNELTDRDFWWDLIILYTIPLCSFPAVKKLICENYPNIEVSESRCREKYGAKFDDISNSQKEIIMLFEAAFDNNADDLAFLKIYSLLGNNLIPFLDVYHSIHDANSVFNDMDDKWVEDDKYNNEKKNDIHDNTEYIIDNEDVYESGDEKFWAVEDYDWEDKDYDWKEEDQKTRVERILFSIYPKFSSEISKEECFFMIAFFIWIIENHTIWFNNIDELNYYLWYVYRKSWNKLNDVQCYNFIESIMEVDKKVCSKMIDLWFYSPYEDDAWNAKDLWSDYWFSASNPIRTAWKEYSKIFLSALWIEWAWWHLVYKEKGTLISKSLWKSAALKRKSEMWNDWNWNIYRCVDEYEVYDNAWKYITNLFVCPYFSSNSTLPPKWFELKAINEFDRYADHFMESLLKMRNLLNNN